MKPRQQRDSDMIKSSLGPLTAIVLATATVAASAQDKSAQPPAGAQPLTTGSVASQALDTGLDAIKASTTVRIPNASLELENFYARVNPLTKGFELSDDDARQHGYMAWKLGRIKGDRTHTATVEIQKAEPGAPIAMISLRYLTAGRTTDFECNIDPASGRTAGRGAAKNDAVTVTDSGQSWRVTCRGASPRGNSDLRVHVAPSVGPSIGNYDPASKGRVRIGSVDISSE